MNPLRLRPRREVRLSTRRGAEADAAGAARAAQAALAALGPSWPPGEARMQAAQTAAESVLWDCIAAPDTSRNDTSRTGRTAPTAGAPSAPADWSLRTTWPVPPLPPPQTRRDVPPARLMLAAGLGALGGMLALSPIARQLAPSPDVGALTATLLGAPLGAAVLVGALLRAAASARLRRVLMALLGLGATSELAALFSALSPWRGIWWRLRRRGHLTRLLLFAAAGGLFALTHRRQQVDREGSQLALEALLLLWLQGARVQLATAADSVEARSRDDEPEILLADLAERLDALRRLPAPPEAQGVAEELLQRLRNRGIAVASETETPPRWDEALRDRYETFGHLEPGQAVAIERAPVLRDGVLLRKGLVRRLRNGGPQ